MNTKNNGVKMTFGGEQIYSCLFAYIWEIFLLFHHRVFYIPDFLKHF